MCEKEISELNCFLGTNPTISEGKCTIAILRKIANLQIREICTHPKDWDDPWDADFFPRGKKLEMKMFWPGWDRGDHSGDDYGDDYLDDDDDDIYIMMHCVSVCH